MKKLVLLSVLIALVIFGCKKSSTTEPTIQCKLLSAATTTNGVTVTTFYTFDNSGKLIAVKQLSGTSDTAVIRQYAYSGNDFSYSSWGDNAGNSDTIYYTYDASKRIIHMVKKNHNTGVTLTTETTFTYNSSNQVTVSVAKSTVDFINYTIDSTLYQYSGSNISNFSQYTKSGSSSWALYKIKLAYDGQRNYRKTTGEPQVSYPYWSAANITQYINPDSTNAYMTYNYTDYTTSSYPQKFTVTFRPDQPNTVISGMLNYKCQ